MFTHSLKKYFHFLLVNILSLFLVFNSFSATKDAYKDDEQLANFVDEFNSKKYTIEDWTILLKKETTLKTKELEEYLAQNPMVKKMAVPTFSFKEGKISFPLEGKNIYVSFINAHETLVEFQGKSVKLNDKMTFKEVKAETSILFKESKTALFDFFIQSAHALDLLLAGTIAFCTIALYSIRGAYRWYEAREKIKTITQSIQNALSVCADSSNDSALVTVLPEFEKALDKLHEDECSATYITSGTRISKAAPHPEFCPSLAEAKKCIADKMKEFKGKEKTADGPRTIGPKEKADTEIKDSLQQLQQKNNNS